MIDTLLTNLWRFDAETARAAHGLPERYVVATLHRPSNVDDPIVAKEIVAALHEIAEDVDVRPVAPRGRAVLEQAALRAHTHIHVEEPVGYVEFISLVRGAVAVLTDSGGVQEETTVLGVPCLTMRPNTERPITISHGTNRLVTRATVVTAFRQVSKDTPSSTRIPPLWDGHAGDRIADIVVKWLVQGH